jgi:hypothetical protein
MSENKAKPATEDVAGLKKQIEALTKSNAEKDEKIKALQTVADLTPSEEKPVEKLTEKQREFTAEWTIQDLNNSNKLTKVSGKGRLKDVPAINLSGVAYSPQEFLKDKDLKAKALRMNHLLIEKLK